MKIISKILLVATAVVALTSCEDLDQDPYNKLSTENAFKTVENASYWSNGFYKKLRDTIYHYQRTAPETQSDLLNASIEYGNIYGEEQQWKILTGNQDASTLWQKQFQALASINLCIEKFPSIPTTSADERESLNRYLGEAYVFRAYHFFTLAQRFCAKYDDSNKNVAELGLPLVLTYDPSALPRRATIEETYSQILSDISQAETLLANKAGSIGANTFTIDGVKALKARVLLSKQDYAGAYETAKTLVDSNRYPLVTTQADLEAMWHKDAKNESILQLFMATDEASYAYDYDIYLGYIADKKAYKANYVPSKWVVDLYEANDLRKNVYLNTVKVEYSTGTFTSTLVNKYPQGLYLGVTNYVHAAKVFRIAEQYLIAAEAAYKNGDENNARTYLNSLRTARGLANVTATGDALFTAIKTERLRELAFEGFRLDDLKRWGDPVRRHDPQDIAYLQRTPASDYQELNKEANHYMFTWPIPAYDIQTNTNLKQNTGYN
ncbi:membrane protein [Capnocytophaga sp. HP1101]